MGGADFLVDVIIQKIMSNNLIANQQDVLSFGAQVPLLVTLFFLAIVGPIAEELVFRQVLMNCLSETIGIACATMISIFYSPLCTHNSPLIFSFICQELFYYLQLT